MGAIIFESLPGTSAPARDPGNVVAQARRAQTAMANQASQGSSILESAIRPSLGKTPKVTPKEIYERKKRARKRNPFS